MGDLPINGQLLEDKVQNFNLIYDASKVRASLQVGEAQTDSPNNVNAAIVDLVYYLQGCVEFENGQSLSAYNGIINSIFKIRHQANESAKVLSCNLVEFQETKVEKLKTLLTIDFQLH